MIAKVNANVNVQSGEQIEIVFDTEKIHLFDKETEMAMR